MLAAVRLPLRGKRAARQEIWGRRRRLPPGYLNLDAELSNVGLYFGDGERVAVTDAARVLARARERLRPESCVTSTTMLRR